MTEIPVIETERLRLRAWRADDISTVAAILSDEQTARFIGGVAPAWHPFRAVATFIGHWSLRGFGFFAVERRDERACIGWCGCWRPDGWPDNEIGYSIRKEHWGHGFATEAARASLRFAYRTLGWTGAISLIDPENVASQRVATRLGAHLEQRDVEVTDFRADVWRHVPRNAFLGGNA